jgi:hypothetical protein
MRCNVITLHRETVKCSVITSYNIASHNSPEEIFCSMAHYMQNHLSLKKIKDLARGYFLYLIQT